MSWTTSAVLLTITRYCASIEIGMVLTSCGVLVRSLWSTVGTDVAVLQSSFVNEEREVHPGVHKRELMLVKISASFYPICVTGGKVLRDY